MSMRQNFMLLFMPLTLVACLPSQDGCFPIENLSVFESPELKEKNLYLISRTTGFHDKVVFYELYEGFPKYDSCGKTDSKLLDTAFNDIYGPDVVALPKIRDKTPENIVIKDSKILISFASKENAENTPYPPPIMVE